jgi:carbamoyl-phosphate synthase large subunit
MFFVKRLLFTGGGGSGSEALYRMLEGRYEVHFADADIEAKPYLIPSNRWHQIPFANDITFIDKLQSLCREIVVNVLIPSVDEELLPIAQSRSGFICDVLLPPQEFIKTHLDKLTSNLFLKTHKLSAPETELLPEHKSILYPFIVKPRQGRGSRDVRIVNSESELQAHVLLSHCQPEDFIVQELLVGQEYTVMMATNLTGVLRAVVPVKVGVKKGITIRAETHCDAAIMNACKAIHAANPVVGCYNIQLVRMENGEVMPFEINPRVSTTACLAMAAGANFIDIFLADSNKENYNNSGLLSFRNHVGLRRTWHNEFVTT